MDPAPPTRSSTPAWVRALALGNLLIAIAWSHYGWRLFKEVGTLTLERQLSEMMAASGDAAGKPVETSRTFSSPRIRIPPAANPPASGNALSVLTWSSPSPQTGVPPRGPRTDESAPGRAPTVLPRAAPRGFNVAFAEATRQGWAVVTAWLVGLLVSGAIGMWLAGSKGVWCVRLVRIVLCAVLLGSGFVMGVMVAGEYHHDWLAAVVGISQRADEWKAFALLAAASASVAGLLAIHRGRGPRPWMALSIASYFVATFATLAAITLLIRSGLPPLDAKIYAQAALAQSFWGWVLLFALLYLPRRTSPAVS